MTRSAFLPVVCLCPFLCPAQTYTISTAAGGANPYFFDGTGDGGPATSAGLAVPAADVAVDASGNMYIVAGPLIRKVISTGTISTFAGGGTSIQDEVAATTAEIAPTAVAVDTRGNVFIADTIFGNSRIRKIDTSGMITTVAGGAPCCTLGDAGPAVQAYIGIPYGIAVDSAGNLYIAQSDGTNNVIRQVLASNGVISTIAGGGKASSDGVQATAVSLAKPTGVAVDSPGNIYIAESAGNRIRMVTKAGIISTFAGDGAATNSGDGGPAQNAGIDAPWHVAVDSSGDLFITQPADARVRMVTTAGNISTIAGTGTHGFSGDNGPAASAQLDQPKGIAALAGGSPVYVADATTGIARVRVLVGRPQVNASGVVPVYSSSTTVQPGSWISIYGSFLATGTATWNGDFPKSLSGTSVTIDSRPGYLWYVSPGQINLQVPDDATTGAVPVVVTTPGGTASATVILGPYAPSFSLFNSKYPAAVVPTPGVPGNSGAGYDFIGPPGAFTFPSRPLKAGETLLLYGVGFGPTNPVVPAGQLYSGAAACVTPPQITIGGAAAQVSFAGIVEAGLFQFNVIVPNAPSGDQILQATVNGIPTQAGVYITMH